MNAVVTISCSQRTPFAARRLFNALVCTMKAFQQLVVLKKFLIGIGDLHYNFCLTIHARHIWIAALLQMGDVFSCCRKSSGAPIAL